MTSFQDLRAFLQHWAPSDRCAFCFLVFCRVWGCSSYKRVNLIWTYFITEGCTLNHYNSIKIQIPFNDLWLPDLAPTSLAYHILFHLPFCWKLTNYTGNVSPWALQASSSLRSFFLLFLCLRFLILTFHVHSCSCSLNYPFICHFSEKTYVIMIIQSQEGFCQNHSVSVTLFHFSLKYHYLKLFNRFIHIL